ncbi:MAG: aminotransferase class I/II-fold pyridoxal phosphate-dependent enzyme, partial [Methanothrix sp.]|nr:aminotransferase class I/II-fold pyridoxal phosphate-dependent enzyme [Methanothrix sp.]
MKQNLKTIPAWNADKHLNQVVKSMPPSGIRKFFDLVNEMDGAISLGVGEPDFVTPWHVREACIYSLESGDTHYTSNKGMPELREAICDQTHNDLTLDYDSAEEILITTGVSEAVDLAFRATLNQGDEVLVPEPCYVAYTPDIVLAGGVSKSVPTRPEDEFRVQPETIAAAVTDKTRGLLLSYPNNPTG